MRLLYAILILDALLLCWANGQTNTPPPLPTQDELNALNVYPTTDSAVGFAEAMKAKEYYEVTRWETTRRKKGVDVATWRVVSVIDMEHNPDMVFRSGPPSYVTFQVDIKSALPDGFPLHRFLYTTDRAASFAGPITIEIEPVGPIKKATNIVVKTIM